MTRPHPPGLHKLASLYGIQTAYRDLYRRRRRASSDVLIEVLAALGAPLAGPRDVRAALRHRLEEMWRRVLPPVVVSWEGDPLRIPVRLPEAAGGVLLCRLHLEDGSQLQQDFAVDALPVAGQERTDSGPYLERVIDINEIIPAGYHTIAIHVAGEEHTAHLFRAPRHTYDPRLGRSRQWGVFAPAYALRSRHDLGAGDLSDLRRLHHLVANHGGDFIATLPLLASFLDDPFEPSPYAPVSRLFWSELYLSLSDLPELATCRAARERLDSSAWRGEVEELRASDLVDYRRLMALKRPVLEELAAASGDAGRAAFVREKPEVEQYARFRAYMERHKAPWSAWPEPQRSGSLQPSDVEPERVRYHIYCQWRLHEQLERLAGGDGARLYLDLPLGVHGDGYDVWRRQSSFVRSCAGGAPPDDFFVHGQNWGFPPLHPEAAQKDGHRTFVAVLRNLLRPAAYMRIDHVMGLHRLFWIPHGREATEGVYVRYPADELYAVLCLESHRHQTRIVGEDLGTVPRYVRRAMGSRGIYRCAVLPFLAREDPGRAIAPLPRRSMASLNTHDMATFAGWWAGRDIDTRVELGFLDPAEAEREHAIRGRIKEALAEFLRRERLLEREGDVTAIMRAALGHFAASGARAVLITLEDLWGETAPQNVPGTSSHERPNWRQRCRHSLEEIASRAEVTHALRFVHRLREGKTPPISREGGDL
ncbi:MAG: 4-alpha-glucanotransferase [Candidatus Eisenbacteria bacterium]|nr:4-alpha-glucanotransferase [Candidatus Eisenbacteria bacterium]